MDGFQAFKYYTAVKLHFTSPRFDLKQTKGKVRGSRQRFESRNDRMLFEKLAGQFPSDQEFIRYIAANFMYNCPDVIYDTPRAQTNYKEYVRRRQSITKIFSDDLETLINQGVQYDFSGHSIPDVVRLYLSNRITLETLVILDGFEHLVKRIRNGLSTQLALMMNDDLLRIERAKMFVKYDELKVSAPYFNFLDTLKWHSNGKDLQTTTRL